MKPLNFSARVRLAWRILFMPVIDAAPVKPVLQGIKFSQVGDPTKWELPAPIEKTGRVNFLDVPLHILEAQRELARTFSPEEITMLNLAMGNGVSPVPKSYFKFVVRMYDEGYLEWGGNVCIWITPAGKIAFDALVKTGQIKK